MDLLLKLFTKALVPLVIMALSLISPFSARRKSKKRMRKAESKSPKKGKHSQAVSWKKTSQSKKRTRSSLHKQANTTSPKVEAAGKKDGKRKLPEPLFVKKTRLTPRQSTLKKSRYADRSIHVEVENLDQDRSIETMLPLTFSSQDIIHGVIWKSILEQPNARR